ncbi:MAG: DUF192 domain-containing protein [Treponema sp.]|jgi:uncharacterized membrane protein (UPF0127 family)|nr:DUF192 domain-containing protein [Treponema sp.]
MNFEFRRIMSIRSFLLVSFFLLACAGRPSFRTTAITIQTTEGNVSLAAEVAETTEERQRGLMFRKSLADGKGMLFVFERDQILSFWMKNTYIPLSIAFIAGDGRIVEIHDMEPLSLASVRSSRSCRYALEAPLGWFTRAKINIGDTMILSAPN